MAAHAHDFLGSSHDRNAKRTRWVVILTAVVMVVEIVAGTLTGSMALLADGWHMATHVVALGASAFAYSFAKARVADPRYSWGTGKVGSLAGFASGLGLVAIALAILYESASRFVAPQAVDYRDALLVAVLGLVINLVSAAMLAGGEGQAHHHHDHGAGHHHHDHNLRSAYLHVLTDALTSLLAIIALAAGWWLGAHWLDPVAGIIGALVILLWSRGLLSETIGVLLDRVPDAALSAELRRRVEEPGDIAIEDWHLWAVGPGRFALLVSARASDAAEIRRRLGNHPRIAHLTVEISWP